MLVSMKMDGININVKLQTSSPLRMGAQMISQEDEKSTLLFSLVPGIFIAFLKKRVCKVHREIKSIFLNYKTLKMEKYVYKKP